MLKRFRETRRSPATATARPPGPKTENSAAELTDNLVQLHGSQAKTTHSSLGNFPRRTGDGPRPVGQAPAWPLVSGRSVRRGSGVKRDFACTFTRRFSPVLVARRSQSRLMLEGRARTLSGPSLDLSQATTLPPSGRRAHLLIRRFLYRHPAPFKSVRDLGLVTARCPCASGTSEGCSSPWLPASLPGADPRPSAFQAGHMPSWRGSCECCALSPVAVACRWSLLLLSPLLSTRRRPPSSKPTRTLQGMARVRSGQAPAWPLSYDRSVRRGSGVKRDFACTFTRHSSPVLVVLRSQSCLMLEGRTRTLSGPSPDLTRPGPTETIEDFFGLPACRAVASLDPM